MNSPGLVFRGATLVALLLTSCTGEATPGQTMAPGSEGNGGEQGNGGGDWGDDSWGGTAGEGAGDGTVGDGSAGSGDGTVGDGTADDGTADDGSDGVVPGQPEPCEGPGSCVRAVGRQLFVNGQLFHIKGVSWNPVGWGQVHPQGLDFVGFADRDIPLMQAAGINCVRTYEPIMDRGVLDKLHAAGIYVINTVYPWGGADASVGANRVEQIKDHPAILMWLVGNEWNYNQLYVNNGDVSWARARVRDVAQRIKAVDTNHPVATSYGHTPDQATIDALPEIDVWGVNIYTGLQFAGLFDEYRRRSRKPLFISEYGADAYNANIGSVDLAAQAEATRVLTEIIFDNASKDNPTNLLIGGTIFAWADEWHKYVGGSPQVQEVHGSSVPGGGPHPDSQFNEEWWGIVDIDRNPRPAYEALKQIYTTR